MGGPLFGVNGTVILGHGSSRSDGIAGAIDTAVRCVDLDLVGGMRQELAEIYQSGALKVS
jgi:fatty acid/phospholipid biosynthesis enzyme